MANKELNFNKAKKTFLTVTLPDDTKLLVKQPTKKIMDDVISLQEDFGDLKNVTTGREDYEALDRLYEVCAEIMNNNIARTEVRQDYLEDLLDMEDLMIFYNTYVNFISEIQSTVKN